MPSSLYLPKPPPGKSTALAVLSGRLAPSGGSVTVSGEDVAGRPDAARSRVAVCPQVRSWLLGAGWVASGAVGSGQPADLPYAHHVPVHGLVMRSHCRELRTAVDCAES